MANSEFGNIEKNDVIYYLALAVLSATLFSFSSFHTLLRIIILFVLIYQAYKNPFNCWGSYIIIQRYIGELFSTYVSVAIFGVVFLSFFIRKPNMVRKLRCGYLFLIGIPLIFISIFVGQNSNITTGLFMGIILLTVIAIINYSCVVTRTDIAKIAYAYCCSALSVAIYFVLSTLLNINILKYGRLSFFGDIKPIAFTAFIPLLFIVSSKLEGKKCFENINNKFFDWLLIAVFSSLIILTAARGMIFAGIVALSIQALLSKNQIRTIWKLIPLVIFVSLFIFMNLNTDYLRISRIFDFQNRDEFNSLNGRTTAWNEYIELYIKGSFIRKLFGFGPGNGGRLVASGLYTHSTYLDFLISYGLIGFVLSLVYEIKAIMKLIQSHDIVLLVVFVFSVIAETTHGSSANFALLSLHVFLLLCLSANKNNTLVVKEKIL